MSKLTKFKLPIIIFAVVAALGAGLYLSGMVGGKAEGPVKKHVVEPIVLSDTFPILLKDADAQAYLALNVAVKLEPMDEAHWLAFSGAGGGGHGGGATEAPGIAKVANYPKFSDAILSVASTYDSATLRTDAGKASFRKALLERFAHIAETDAAEAKSSAGGDDPAHLGPPWHVHDVLFTKFVLQKNA